MIQHVIRLGLFCLVVTPSLADTNSPAVTNSWGTPVHGVQLSVQLTNTVLTRGAPVVFTACVTNSSTNVIGIAIITIGPFLGFKVVMIDESGKEFDPRTTVFPNAGSSGPPSRISPGSKEAHEIIIFDFNRSLKPGNYKLKVTRPFSIETSGHFKIPPDFYDVTAKLLEVRVR